MDAEVAGWAAARLGPEQGEALIRGTRLDAMGITLRPTFLACPAERGMIRKPTIAWPLSRLRSPTHWLMLRAPEIYRLKAEALLQNGDSRSASSDAARSLSGKSQHAADLRAHRRPPSSNNFLASLNHPSSPHGPRFLLTRWPRVNGPR